MHLHWCCTFPVTAADVLSLPVCLPFSATRRISFTFANPWCSWVNEGMDERTCKGLLLPYRTWGLKLGSDFQVVVLELRCCLTTTICWEGSFSLVIYSKLTTPQMIFTCGVIYPQAGKVLSTKVLCWDKNCPYLNFPLHRHRTTPKKGKRYRNSKRKRRMGGRQRKSKEGRRGDGRPRLQPAYLHLPWITDL